MVIGRRFTSSLLWMFLVLIFLFDGFLLVLKILSWDPFLGILDWLAVLFSWWSLMYHTILYATLICFGFLHLKVCSVEQQTSCTRWEILCQMMSIQKILHMILLCILGSLSVFCFFGYIGGAAFVARKPGFFENMFLIETSGENSFLVYNGVFAGALFGWKYYMNDWYLLKFVLVSKPKMAVFTSKLPGIFKESTVHIVKSLHYHYISYAICGPFIARWFSVFSKSLSSSQVSLYSMKNLKLFLAAFVVSIILHITWRIFIEIFNIFMTERYEFSLSENGSEEQMPLSKALDHQENLITYLAYMDLRYLAQFSQTRRKMFFTISTPGGHPKQWLFLSSVCIKRLTYFLDKIEWLVVYEKSNSAKLPIRKVIKEDINANSPFCFYKKMVQDYLETLPLYTYFAQELPDTKAVQVFTTSQLEIWTIEALGFFLAFAYTEDTLGVFQQTLPKLLSLVIDLKLCEEKLPVSVLSFKKYAKDSKFLHQAISQRQTLKSALESAIYRIILAFKTDIRNVMLPDDHHRLLERYLEFKR